jgi:hypothetical protein
VKEVRMTMTRNGVIINSFVAARPRRAMLTAVYGPGARNWQIVLRDDGGRTWVLGAPSVSTPMRRVSDVLCHDGVSAWVGRATIYASYYDIEILIPLPGRYVDYLAYPLFCGDDKNKVVAGVLYDRSACFVLSCHDGSYSFADACDVDALRTAAARLAGSGRLVWIVPPV